MNIFQNDWDELLIPEMDKPYMKLLRTFLSGQYKTADIYPPSNRIFSALQLTSYTQTKVVILGQDPYHTPGVANGLSFSVHLGKKIPPSLANIFIELENDTGKPKPESGCLEHWAKQGVLLLNAVLTVQKSSPNSHAGKGWETFTDRILSLLNEKESPVAFVFWGAYAQKKKPLITNKQHLVIESPHPSPFSAHKGFFGSRPFSRVNAFLAENHQQTVQWN